jgi:hypothetical protein
MRSQVLHVSLTSCAVYLLGYSENLVSLEANKPILLRQNEKQADI